MRTQTSRKAALFARASRMNVLWVFAVVACTLAFLLVRPSQADAASSSTINFQARLETSAGAIVPNGTYNVEFKLYNTSTVTGTPDQGACTYNGGTADPNCLWAETRTGANQVRVVNGYLTVSLGSVTAFLGAINWNQPLYLTMRIGGTGAIPAWDTEMSPRLQLTAVPYAFTSGTVATTDSSGHTGTLSFPTSLANATDAITLPDASGTLCLQGSSSCNFAPASGSGSYIQNATSPQTANFNITGTGVAGTLEATILDTASAGAFTIGNTNATSINLGNATSNIQTTINGTALVKPTSGHDSITAFQVQNASGSSLLTIDTTNSNVGIGTSVPSNRLSVSPLDYQTGTVTRTNGSATLVGTGTTWTSSMVGDIIIFADGTTNTASAFTDATHITMGATYTGTTDASPVTYRFHKVGLQVTNSGNVGIGTTSPGSDMLSVALGTAPVDSGVLIAGTSATYGDIGLRIQNTGTGGGTWSLDSTNNGSGYGGNKLVVRGNGNPYLTIVSSGNVGIGTTTPSYELEVNGIAQIDNWLYTSGNVGWYNSTYGGGWYMQDSTWIRNYNSKATYLYGNGSVALATANGNVGIGTTAPGYTLQVQGDTYTSGSYYVSSEMQLTSNQIDLQSGAGNTEFAINYSGKANVPLSIYNGSGGLKAQINPNGNSYFVGGNVGVGTSSPGAPLQVYGQMGQGQLRLQSTGTSAYWNLGPDSSSNNIVVYSSGGGGAYMLNTSTSWSGRSDQRLKTNITPLSVSDPLAKIMQLNPVSYTWKNVSQSGITNLGFIAQQVQQVFPELVSDSGDATITLADGSQQTIHDALGVQYDGLISPTVAAVQELDGQVQHQQAAITALQTNTNFAALNVSGVATLDSLTVVNNAIFAANIMVGGHIVTWGNTPTSASLPAAGTDTQGLNTGTCTVTGNDTSGSVSIATGTANLRTGSQCTVTFAQPFASTPHPVLTPVGRLSQAVGAYIDSVSTTSLSVAFAQAPTPGTVYTFDFFTSQ